MDCNLKRADEDIVAWLHKQKIITELSNQKQQKYHVLVAFITCTFI